MDAVSRICDRARGPMARLRRDGIARRTGRLGEKGDVNAFTRQYRAAAPCRDQHGRPHERPPTASHDGLERIRTRNLDRAWRMRERLARRWASGLDNRIDEKRTLGGER